MYKNMFDYPCLMLYSIAFNLLVYFIWVSLLAFICTSGFPLSMLCTLTHPLCTEYVSCGSFHSIALSHHVLPVSFILPENVAPVCPFVGSPSFITLRSYAI